MSDPLRVYIGAPDIQANGPRNLWDRYHTNGDNLRPLRELQGILIPKTDTGLGVPDKELNGGERRENYQLLVSADPNCVNVIPLSARSMKRHSRLVASIGAFQKELLDILHVSSRTGSSEH